MKKDKVFELRIEDDDEISGVDFISLVSEPAIEYDYVFFNKQKPEDFHVPEGEDDKYINMFMSKGQPEHELLDNGWEIESITEMGHHEFGLDATTPNDESSEDTDFYRTRYKYGLSSNINESEIIPTTREYCRTLLNRNYVWRIEEINTLNPNSDPDDGGFGGQPKFYRGGFNCRHRWFKILYKNEGAIRNKSSIGTNKIKDDAGRSSDLGTDWYQPNLVTSKTLANPSPETIRNLGLSKEKFEEGCPKATQDVATNLKNRQKAINIAHYGPLNPNEPNEDYWKAKAKMFGGDVESAKKARCGNCAFFVQTKNMLDCIASGINDTNEWDTVKAGDLGYCEAFDFKCAAARTCDAWVVGGPITEEDLGYDVGGLPAYVDQIQTGKTKNNFQSYSDYPQAVRDNAKRVLKWVEENGWGSCGTEVGKIRANQLADGKPITEETIMRMYSYLSRHKVDLQSSKSYEDGCGKLMYDSWGGKEALGWAERKLRKLQAEKMSRQNFQTQDEEKRILLGPCMVPDQRIFRKDKDGNPYFVFFTKETISQIQEKFMRKKYLDNADTEHNGKAEQDVYVIESWIKEDEHDKSNKYGFGDLPIGTWFVSMKVRNDEVWKKVKDGSLAGYSVSGFFEEVEQFSKEYMFLQQLSDLLKNIKE